MAQWWERSPPTNVARVRFRPGAIHTVCGLSLLLVLALLWGFFSGFSGFPPSWKTNTSKFQFDLDRGPAWKPASADVASSLNIVIYYLFIYLIIIITFIVRKFKLFIKCSKEHYKLKLKTDKKAKSFYYRIYCMLCTWERHFVVLLSLLSIIHLYIY